MSEIPNYVMYILVNKSLPMKTGKIASQVGHAVQKVTEYCLKNKKDIWKKYCKNNYPKIVLKVPSEELLLEILNKLKNFERIPIIDLGRTQIKPNSLTTVGFIPIIKDDIPDCIKELKLL